jgi:hypothetical protein
VRSEVQLLPDPPGSEDSLRLLSRQKPRFLPAACGVMSAKIASCDFGQWTRGHSSAGRAPALQAGGRRFDPGWLHHLNEISEACDVEMAFVSSMRMPCLDRAAIEPCGSLTIRKVFVLTLSFQANVFIECLKMSRSHVRRDISAITP